MRSSLKIDFKSSIASLNHDRINLMRKIINGLIILLFSTQAFAWWETPHMLVAQIAYDKLNPETKRWADDLIALHAKQNPNSNDFVTAAVWADDIRAQGNTTYSTWHYVTLTFKEQTDPLPTKEDFPSRDQIAWAIELEMRILASKETTQDEKGLALRRLIHWVGDIHQPLHATTHISPNYPKGDSGGNAFTVNLPKPYNNLHSLWDSGLDNWEDVYRPLTPQGKTYLKDEASRLSKQNKQTLKTTIDPYAWAIESHELARSYAYTGINYKGVPSPAYTEQGQMISERQVAKAGERLAAILNQLAN
jgi:hypothetical protein